MSLVPLVAGVWAPLVVTGSRWLACAAGTQSWGWACAGGRVHLPDFGPYKSYVKSCPYLKQIVLCVVKNAWFCGCLWVLLAGCQVMDHFMPPHPTSGFHGFFPNPPYHTPSPEGITGAHPRHTESEFAFPQCPYEFCLHRKESITYSLKLRWISF